MGDAGPGTPPPSIYIPKEPKIVTVLITGFGPFKSFITNPSHSIARSLPEYLYPEAKSFAVDAPADFAGLAAIRPITITAPVIHVIVHPEQIRVSYASVPKTASQLIAKYDPDYIIHFGMAAGRDHYTLETLARRDGYKIKDNDGQEGFAFGELNWREANLPEMLWTGWDEDDVLARWRGEVARTCAGDEKAVVRLSRDAGRYLCEFILYNSLADQAKAALAGGEKEQERNGKAAFFHVPGGTDALSIERGRRIAEAAIRALVGSWEEGFRRPSVSMQGVKVFTP